MRVLVILNAGFYLLIVLVNPQTIKTIAFGVPHYLYYMPTYLHIMVVYSFCRIDDLSWGTKGAHTSDPTGRTKEYKDFKVEFVGKWLIANAIISYSVIVITSDPNNQDIFLTVLIFFITMLVSIKSFFAFLYAIRFYFFDQSQYYHHLKDLRVYYEAQTLAIKEYYEKIKMRGFTASMKLDSVVENREMGFKPESSQELIESNSNMHLRNPSYQQTEKTKVNQFLLYGKNDSIWK
jgi:chitin synthase